MLTLWQAKYMVENETTNSRDNIYYVSFEIYGGE